MILLEHARAGELHLHVPAFCLREGMSTVQRKLQPRSDRQAVLRFLRWAQLRRGSPTKEIEALGSLVDGFEQSVKHELSRVHLERRIKEIRETPGVEIFALDEVMIGRLVELGASGPKLGALDEAVLAAVLGRASELRAHGASTVIFCEKDGDLLPWFKKGQERGRPREPLATYYREAGIEVLDGFLLD